MKSSCYPLTHLNFLNKRYMFSITHDLFDKDILSPNQYHHMTLLNTMFNKHIDFSKSQMDHSRGKVQLPWNKLPLEFQSPRDSNSIDEFYNAVSTVVMERSPGCVESETDVTRLMRELLLDPERKEIPTMKASHGAKGDRSPQYMNLFPPGLSLLSDDVYPESPFVTIRRIVTCGGDILVVLKNQETGKWVQMVAGAEPFQIANYFTKPVQRVIRGNKEEFTWSYNPDLPFHPLYGWVRMDMSEGVPCWRVAGTEIIGCQADFYWPLVYAAGMFK